MLREYTRPLQDEIDSDANVFSILQERVRRTPQDSLVEYADEAGTWHSFTASQFRDRVVAVAKGLIARGVMPGDAVAVIARTSWQWTVLDMAIMAIGAVTVPVYETSSSTQIRMILHDAQVTLAFAEDDGQRDKIEMVRGDCTGLRDVYVIACGALETLTEFGRGIDDEVFEERTLLVHGDDLATIVYTSGSTGTPKGVELSHSNFVFIAHSGVLTMPDIAMKPNRRLLLFLPLAHVFARYMQFFCFAGNVTLGLSGNMKMILADFKAFKPTFILAVPRVFEKIHNAASQKAGTGLAGRVFSRAAHTARRWSAIQQSGRRIPLRLRLIHALYARLVYSSIMAVFGGSVEYAVSGGAPLDSSIAHFFNGIGLPLLEGYGMTETCAPASVNPTVGYRIGTIGLPLQGVSMAVADDGELCVRSRAVCAGYHHHPELTERQIVDGWLHTGDLGSIDDDGFVRIVGRKKDLIITAGGKNVSPGEMEARVMTSPVVSQCVIIGEGKPFIAAIIALDLPETNLWLRSMGASPVDSLPQAADSPIVRAEVERVVNAANELVSRAESIRRFEIVDDEFTEANGLVTPSLKARRQVVGERYRELIDTVIYAPRM